MAQRFNPPPNWPAPPQGWTPPPGWQPDPAWGPAPEEWPLWVKDRPNTQAGRWSLLSGLVLYVVLLVIGSLVAAGPPSPEAAGSIFARVLVAALLTWLIAHLSSGRWPRWVYPLVVVGISLVLSAITVAGQTSQGV